VSHPAVTGAIFAMLLMAASFQALAADPPPAPPQDNSNCVSVQVDGVKNYDCANAKMQGEVGGDTLADIKLPYSATSPSQVTGQFNEAATRNRLGQNFGKSVTPYRPPVVPNNPPK